MVDCVEETKNKSSKRKVNLGRIVVSRIMTVLLRKVKKTALLATVEKGQTAATFCTRGDESLLTPIQFWVD
jgi:preprotein translocase subunit SecG